MQNKFVFITTTVLYNLTQKFHLNENSKLSRLREWRSGGKCKLYEAMFSADWIHTVNYSYIKHHPVMKINQHFIFVRKDVISKQ